MTVTAAEARDLALKKLQGREPLTGEYPVRLESAPVQRLIAARLALDEAEEGDDTEALEAAKTELAAAQAQVDDTTIVLTVQSIDPTVFDQILEDHPPTEEDLQQAQTRGHQPPEYAPSFRPALVAACCTFPGFQSAEEAQAALWGGGWKLSRTEADDIFTLALVVCRGRREVIDWGKDSGGTAA